MGIGMQVSEDENSSSETEDGENERPTKYTEDELSMLRKEVCICPCLSVFNPGVKSTTVVSQGVYLNINSELLPNCYLKQNYLVT